MAREVEAYEVTFSGLDADRLETPVLSRHNGSDASWARVAGVHRDDVIQELAAAGARLVSLAPVGSTLEEFLLHHYQKGGQP
jgi:hypothetical protein